MTDRGNEETEIANGGEDRANAAETNKATDKPNAKDIE